MMSDLEMVVYNILEDTPKIYENIKENQRMSLVHKVTERLENGILDDVIRETIEDVAYDEFIVEDD
jgi:hypothetical protein